MFYKDDIDIRVGARVRALREMAGLTQAQLGTAVSVTYQQIQKYEVGRNRISVGTLHRIADALGVPASLFLEPQHRSDPANTAEMLGMSAEQWQMARSWGQIGNDHIQTRVLALVQAVSGFCADRRGELGRA